MIRCVLTCILMLIAGSALAQVSVAEERFVTEGLKHFDYTRYVPSSVKRTIGFIYGAQIDCTAMTGMEVKITKEPQHGTVEIVPGEMFPNFAKDNPRSKCNVKKQKGMLLNYTAEKGYTGTDTVEVFVMFPSGYAHEAVYDITVK
jgi:hypothetical protein